MLAPAPPEKPNGNGKITPYSIYIGSISFTLATGVSLYQNTFAKSMNAAVRPFVALVEHVAVGAVTGSAAFLVTAGIIQIPYVLHETFGLRLPQKVKLPFIALSIGAGIYAAHFAYGRATDRLHQLEEWVATLPRQQDQNYPAQEKTALLPGRPNLPHRPGKPRLLPG